MLDSPVNSALAGRLFQLFVIIACLIGAVYLGNLVAGEQYKVIASIAAVGVAFLLYFFFAKYLWMICYASVFLSGGFTFLPLGLRPFEVLLIGGVCHFTLDQIVLKKRMPKLGIKPDGPILILALVVIIYHAAKDRLGVRLLGSDIWGGRAYLGILVAAIAYFCLQSLKMDTKTWSRLPLVIFVVGLLGFLVSVVSLVSPRAGDLIALFYTGGYSDIPGETLTRLGFLGAFGYILLTWALSKSTIPAFVASGRLFPPLIFFVGLLLCLSSGYRSSLMLAVVIILVASVRDLRWNTLIFVVLGLLFLSSVSLFHSQVYRLPAGVQRGLVWIPGDWDPELIQSAEGSDEFRWSVWEYWTKYYFPIHPWLGRGLGVPYEELLATLPTLQGFNADTGNSVVNYGDRDQAFATTGNIHNGFLSVIDRFGLIGGFFVFALTLIALKRYLSFILQTKLSKATAALHWMSIYGAAWIICYPIGALRVDDFLPVLILSLGIFNALRANAMAEENNSVAILPGPGANALQGAA